MIKLMIVDDEAIIRQGLRQSVNWEEHGITIVGEARNGSAALEKALILHPDIVISDIRMAEGDGIRLANQLQKMLPQVRMIMLSGYSDMEYMMEAIKLGVRDYLLKPAGTAQILQSALKLRDEILAERQREQNSSRMEDLINENIDTLKNHFLKELLAGQLTAELIAEKTESLHISFPGPLHTLFMIAPKPDKAWELLQMASLLLKKYTPMLISHKDGVTIAILNISGLQDLDEIQAAAKQLRDIADSLLIPCVGEPCPLDRLHELYAACMGTMSRSIWFTKTCLTARIGSEFPALPEKELLIIERGVVQSVRATNHGQLAEEIDALFVLLEGCTPTIKSFQEILLGIAHSIRIFSENNDLLARLEALFEGPYTVADAKDTMLSIINSGYSKYGTQVKNALVFMSNRYMTELSLSDVAGELYISPSYLTRLLKSKTGLSFNEWLHHMRIEKAKELLRESDLRHYEIAERVGYRSYKVFSEYFNKLAGCSARSYREKI